MKKAIGIFVLISAVCPLCPAAVIGINDNWSTAMKTGSFTPTAVSDGTVKLTAAAHGQTSWGGSNGTEWDMMQGISGRVARNADEAIALGSYIEFTFESCGDSPERFSLEAITLHLSRNGAQTASSFQFACSADDVWTTEDLLGTALYAETTDPLEISVGAADLPARIMKGTVRLYHWDNWVDDASKHPNREANFHLLDISASYRVIQTSLGLITANDSMDEGSGRFADHAGERPGTVPKPASVSADESYGVVRISPLVIRSRNKFSLTPLTAAPGSASS